MPLPHYNQLYQRSDDNSTGWPYFGFRWMSGPGRAYASASAHTDYIFPEPGKLSEPIVVIPLGE